MYKGGGTMGEEYMTDFQFKTMFHMFDMILDGCKDIEEAKQKVRGLMEEQDNRIKDKDTEDRG